MKDSLRFKGPAWLLLASSLSQIGLLASAPVIARSMGPEARGFYYPLLALVAIFTSIAVMGSPQQFRVLVPNGSNLRSFFLKGISVYAGVLFVSATWIALDSNLFDGFKLEALLLCLIWLASAVQANAFAVLIAKEEFKKLAAIQFLLPGSHMLLALLVVTRGLSAADYFLYFHLVALILGMLWSWKLIGPDLSARSSVKGKPDFWAKSIKSFFPNLLLAMFSRIDLVMVALVFGPSTAGIYSIAVTATAPLIVLYEPISAKLFPKFSPSADTDSPTGVNREALMSPYFSLVIFSGLVLAVVSYLLIEPIFGADFEAAAPIALVLAISSSLAVLAVITNDLVIASGYALQATINSLGGLALFILVALLFGGFSIFFIIFGLAVWYGLTLALNLRILGIGLFGLILTPTRALQGLKALL